MTHEATLEVTLSFSLRRLEESMRRVSQAAERSVEAVRALRFAMWWGAFSEGVHAANLRRLSDHWPAKTL